MPKNRKERPKVSVPEEQLEEQLEDQLEEKGKKELGKDILTQREKETRLSGLWQKLLEQQPTNEDLRHIIMWGKPLREVAKTPLQSSKEEIIREMRRLG